MDEYPEHLTTDQVKANIDRLPTRAELVAIGEHVYKREGDKWRRLEGAPRRSDGS